MFQAALEEGLRFSCRRCSGCCSGSPGIVRLGKSDLARLLEGLGMDQQSFVADYCRILHSSEGSCLCLREKPDNDCIFLESGTCSVYDWRPTQCRTYPFWDEIVETEENWKREGACCPGIGSGRLWKAEEIIGRILEQRGCKPYNPEEKVSEGTSR